MVRTSNTSPIRTIDRQGLRRLAQRVWNAYHRSSRCEISLAFLAIDEMISLHRTYFNRSTPTDVISFDLGSTPEQVRIADIYICPEVAAENAREFDVTLAQELARLVVHGMLHVIGFDDATPAERQDMHELEDKFLQDANFL